MDRFECTYVTLFQAISDSLLWEDDELFVAEFKDMQTKKKQRSVAIDYLFRVYKMHWLIFT